MCESENKRNKHHGSDMDSSKERRFHWFTDLLRLCVRVIRPAGMRGSAREGGREQRENQRMSMRNLGLEFL